MKKARILGICLLACMALMGHAQTKSWTADNGNGTFTNPLFYDEFSDPDVIRVGDDYYLAGTTMHTVPGLVILHSKDLVNWEFASYCFDRFDFPEDRFALRNHQEIYGQGIWAPAIRYANGQFYVFSNINGKGLQCYTAKDIHGPWTHHNMQGNIYDLSVLFDDDGKIYAIHKYGEVHCTELKPDMSGPVEGTDRVIIPEGNGVGEGHHMYKINGMYYLISTDYSPNGRTLCSRSKSIWGPYETRIIEADETYGYHGVGRTTVPRGEKYRIGSDGTKFGVAPASPDATGCDNAHQGGIVQAKDGTWWALLMQDFHSVGRTVCLMPITWEDGWPMVGLKGNPGRAPRTWFKPDTKLGCYGIGEEAQPMRAPYDRSDNFNGKALKPIWQWNHNPDDKLWSLKGGRLRIQSQPSEQLMWARNTLTQRVIGPKSIATVELYTKGMKDGDVCGLGNINVPCSWIGIVKQGNTLTLRSFEQMTNDTVTVPVDLVNGKILLRCIGDYDNNQMQYAYSTDGVTFQTLGRMMPLTYQLITFQGSRHALFAYNIKGKQGGYAEFDNFTVEEPCADRSQNIPYGKTIRIINKATGRPAIALKHGVLYDTHAGDKSQLTQFKVIDRGQGRVALQCADGRYLKVYGDGLPGDVRFTTTLVPSGSAAGATPTTDDINSTTFLWQDFLDHDFMLLSLKNHRYLGKSPTTGSPYSWDFTGSDPARRNGAVLQWEEVPIVSTTNGQVQGIVQEGSLAFLGIPYARVERFMPPQPVEKWQGVRLCDQWGPQAMQQTNRPMTEAEMSEQCCVLNVWTKKTPSNSPCLGGEQKSSLNREDIGGSPVMVWFHGGGFDSGTSAWDPGMCLAQKDVVVVSVNHRLNILGFLDLSTCGEKYQHSGNVGMLDCVAALEWVRDNIAQFGGDPNNVTIFGESGGGGKVGTLLCMPPARGLFHKAIIMSGTILNVNTKAMTEELGEAVLKELGIDKANVDKIKDVSYKDLYAAGQRAMAASIGTRRPGTPMMWGFGPTPDGSDVVQQPFQPAFPDFSDNIPIMIGTTFNELQRQRYNQPMTLDEARTELQRTFGDETDAYVSAFAKAYPDYTPQDLLSIDWLFRPKTIITADAIGGRRKADTYVYMFTVNERGKDDNFKGSAHGAELKYCFDVLHHYANQLSPTTLEENKPWATQMSDVWAQFAHTGNPNTAGLPAWHPYTKANGELLEFGGTKPRLHHNHDRRLSEIIDRHCFQQLDEFRAKQRQ